MRFTGADKVQFCSAAEIDVIQNRELKKVITHLSNCSPFYKRLFASHAVNTAAINTIEDLKKLPFTTKADLQAHNKDFLCVPAGKIIDYAATSGTSGTPVTIGLTENDLLRLAANECNSLKITGGSSEDIYQLMTTIDRQFMAGLAYAMGVRKLGAGMIRVGNGVPELQWDTIRRLSPTAIICVPSFILKLVAYAEQNGIDYRASSIKKAICIGEPLRNKDFSLNNLGRKITEKWGLELYSTYASSEMAAAFTECKAGNGGHLQPELIIGEIIDENDRPVDVGESGELVITTLGIEGMPLLRYRTGDICSIETSHCSCGRRTPRISPILGRKNQMIKYKGTTLYPSSMYDILEGVEQVKNYQVEIYTNDIGTDEILIRLGCDQISEQLEAEIKDRFRAKLRAVPIIQSVDPALLHKMIFPEINKKAKKFIDSRTSFQKIADSGVN